MFGFSALQCSFEELTLFVLRQVSSLKTKWILDVVTWL